MTDNRSKSKLSDAYPMNSHSKSTIIIRKQKDINNMNSARNSTKANKGTFREAHKVVLIHAMPKSMFRSSST